MPSLSFKRCVSRHSPSIVAVACVVWVLLLGGCQHPLAQRSVLDWTVVRVLPSDDVSHRSAQLRPVSKAGRYHLAREWDPKGTYDFTQWPPIQLTGVYLRPGDPLGFTLNAEGRIVAMAGQQQELLIVEDGVHHIWYREGSHAGNALKIVGSTALAVTLLVGFVALKSLNDDDKECRHGYRSSCIYGCRR